MNSGEPERESRVVSGFGSRDPKKSSALRPKGFFVTNVRFGFVDTKMAKGNFKPLLMSVDKAVDHLIGCIKSRPVSHTAPKSVVPLVKLRRIMMKLGAK